MNDERTGEVTLIERPRPAPVQPSPPPFALRVFIYRAGCFCGTEVFTQPEVLIGRHPRSDLHLLCETVSGAHALVRVEGDRLLLEDSGSKNGVRVNGQPVLDCLLDEWDEVGIGTFVLRFQLIGSWPIDRPRGPLRPALYWDPQVDPTAEEVTIQVPEPRLDGIFPLADLLEPSCTDAQVLSSWARCHGHGRSHPIREVG